MWATASPYAAAVFNEAARAYTQTFRPSADTGTNWMLPATNVPASSGRSERKVYRMRDPAAAGAAGDFPGVAGARLVATTLGAAAFPVPTTANSCGTSS